MLFNGAHAAQPLFFDAESKTARVDLNGDGQEESIVRVREEAGFSYRVSAGDVMLGELRGQNLMLGDGRHHGVRNLLLFNDAYNDFRYSIYEWDAMAQRYNEKEDSEKRD
ncbi:MAG: hypothetical protein ACRBCT_03110 [Alphaproteobacteria bacterium]